MSKLNIFLFQLNLNTISKLDYHYIFKNSNKFNIKYIVTLDKDYNSHDNFINYFKEKEKIFNIFKHSNIHAIIVNTPKEYNIEIIKLGLMYNKHVLIFSTISNHYEEIVECFELAEKKK